MPPIAATFGRRAAALPRRRRGRPGEPGAGAAAENRHWPVLALLLAALSRRSAARAWLAAPPGCSRGGRRRASRTTCAPFLVLPPLRAMCVARAAACGLAASPASPRPEELAAEPA